MTKEKIRDRVCAYYGARPEDIFITTKKQSIVDIRKMVYYMLYTEGKMSGLQIASFLKCKTPNIYHHLCNATWDVEHNKRFATEVEEVRSMLYLEPTKSERWTIQENGQDIDVTYTRFGGRKVINKLHCDNLCSAFLSLSSHGSRDPIRQIIERLP